MQLKASILISSFNRLPLWRRTLWAIAHRPPTCSFEVVVCDDGSTDDVLGELRKYSSVFPWTFVRFDRAGFEAATGLSKFWNNPCVTNNLAWRHSKGELLFQQGNEVLVTDGAYDTLIADLESLQEGDAARPALVFSTTYDLPAQHLARLDELGTNLNRAMVADCVAWPLHSEHYRSGVTNYLSLAPRSLWEVLGGYDERYYGGISAEDSDFTRRARVLPGFRETISAGVTLHQYHGGVTRYYKASPKVISEARFREGCSINRAIYDSWDGSHHNRQRWPAGTLGSGEVITNA